MPDDAAEDAFLAVKWSLEEWKQREAVREKHVETFLVSERNNSELKEKDICSPADRKRVEEGKLTEWNKLVKHGAVKVYSGVEAEENL